MKYISFKNYKAFKTGELEIKPLTVLLGANSSGKSSIIKLIMMLSQSINYQRDYKSLLRLNGDYTTLGEIQNIFYQHNTSQPLTLSFMIDTERFFNDIDNHANMLNFIFFSIYRQLQKLADAIPSFELPGDLLHAIMNINDTLESRIHIFQTNIKEIKKYYDKLKKNDKEKLLHALDAKSQSSLDSIFTMDFKSIIEANTLLSEILQSKEKVTNIKFNISFKVQSASKTPYINDLNLEFDNKVFLNYKKEGKKHSLISSYSYLSEINKYHVEFGKKILSNQIFTKIFSNHIEDNISKPTINLLVSIFDLCFGQITDKLDETKINYITPLRASPKRYYFLDEFNVNSSLNTIDGDNLTEVLKENDEIKEKVNIWLKKYGLDVNVDELKNEIHALKIGQYGLNLSVQDVGFGISQVLPIIVQGFLSQKDSLTLIEQPEIHLHPKMQAELTDLFIDIVNTKKSLLIETHSEYFLKRLRRRIAEKIISSDDVAIYYVEPDGSGKGSKISRIDISETGAFEWPKDFYSDDLEDTLAFLKHQNNDISSNKQTPESQKGQK